ncbi:MAG: hypothetical protein L3K10_01805 [Thermoplasmata archaeon]|nr:hypothetical protein [Thermoplasmata archaeon]
MENRLERAMGHLFGLVGGLLILLGGVVAATFGVADLVLGRFAGAAADLGATIVLLVVGSLVLVFAHLADRQWKERPLTSGVLLVVLPLIGWAVLGLGTNVVALVGGILVVLAGVLYLIEPTEHAALVLGSHA